MKALQLEGINKVNLVEIEVPSIKDDEILVKTGAAVICTSDLNDMRENPFDIRLPVVFGHEGAGVVAKTGAKVSQFKPGDHVATHPVHPCGKCDNCLNGRSHLCLSMGHFGINRPGTFAEFYPVRADRARLVDPSLPFSQAALAEPVSVCLEALQQSHLTGGDALLVMGDGPFGILMTRLAQQYALRETVIAGWSNFRLNYAFTLSRVNTYANPDPEKTLLEKNKGKPYDVVILAVGSQAAFHLGIKLLRSKGRLVVFSAIPKETPIDLFDIHVRELEIVGACNDQDLFDQAVNLLHNPELKLGELITHSFHLTEYRQAFDLAANGQDRALKVAFQFEGVG